MRKYDRIFGLYSIITLISQAKGTRWTPNSLRSTWTLDQFVAPSYPTEEEVVLGKRKIREDVWMLRDNFNTFRFADYKDTVIDLIRRVATSA